VSVNKHLVRLPDRLVTGLQILEAAKAQGVKIDLDFQLWEVLGEGREHQIGDTDEIAVREGSRFQGHSPGRQLVSPTISTSSWATFGLEDMELAGAVSPAVASAVTVVRSAFAGHAVHRVARSSERSLRRH